MAKAARIMITIPAELAERLEPYRGRFNISAVCADALRQQVESMDAQERQRDNELEHLRREVARLTTLYGHKDK